MTFYDKDSNPITERLDESMKKRYLKEIRADFNYFKDSYERADFQINIENVKLENIPDLIIEKMGIDTLMPAPQKEFVRL